jgi:hypothetical protein
MIGIAKFNAGISTQGKFKPLETNLKNKLGVAIIKGMKYEIPDNYDFDLPGAIFEKAESQKKEKK